MRQFKTLKGASVHYLGRYLFLKNNKYFSLFSSARSSRQPPSMSPPLSKSQLKPPHPSVSIQTTKTGKQWTPRRISTARKLFRIRHWESLDAMSCQWGRTGVTWGRIKLLWTLYRVRSSHYCRTHMAHKNGD